MTFLLLCWLLALLIAPLSPASGAAVDAGTENGLRVGVLWWPSSPSMDGYWAGREFEGCLSRTIRYAAPEFAVIEQQRIRDYLYPLMEPGTEPKTEAEFGKLLARTDVRERLSQRGLDYLVAFSGSTRTYDQKGGVLCGAGYGGAGCLGFYWEGEATTLEAALWDMEESSLTEASEPKRARGTAEGKTYIPAFVLPLPMFAATETEACRELGHRIVLLIREDSGKSAGPRPPSDDAGWPPPHPDR